MLERLHANAIEQRSRRGCIIVIVGIFLIEWWKLELQQRHRRPNRKVGSDVRSLPEWRVRRVQQQRR